MPPKKAKAFVKGTRRPAPPAADSEAAGRIGAKNTRVNQRRDKGKQPATAAVSSEVSPSPVVVNGDSAAAPAPVVTPANENTPATNPGQAGMAAQPRASTDALVSRETSPPQLVESGSGDPTAPAFTAADRDRVKATVLDMLSKGRTVARGTVVAACVAAKVDEGVAKQAIKAMVEDPACELFRNSERDLRLAIGECALTAAATHLEALIQLRVAGHVEFPQPPWARASKKPLRALWNTSLRGSGAWKMTDAAARDEELHGERCRIARVLERIRDALAHPEQADYPTHSVLWPCFLRRYRDVIDCTGLVGLEDSDLAPADPHDDDDNDDSDATELLLSRDGLRIIQRAVFAAWCRHGAAFTADAVRDELTMPLKCPSLNVIRQALHNLVMDPLCELRQDGDGRLTIALRDTPGFALAWHLAAREVVLSRGLAHDASRVSAADVAAALGHLPGVAPQDSPPKQLRCQWSEGDEPRVFVANQELLAGRLECDAVRTVTGSVALDIVQHSVLFPFLCERFPSGVPVRWPKLRTGAAVRAADSGDDHDADGQATIFNNLEPDPTNHWTRLALRKAIFEVATTARSAKKLGRLRAPVRDVTAHLNADGGSWTVAAIGTHMRCLAADPYCELMAERSTAFICRFARALVTQIAWHLEARRSLREERRRAVRRSAIHVPWQRNHVETAPRAVWSFSGSGLMAALRSEADEDDLTGPCNIPRLLKRLQPGVPEADQATVERLRESSMLWHKLVEHYGECMDLDSPADAPPHSRPPSSALAPGVVVVNALPPALATQPGHSGDDDDGCTSLPSVADPSDDGSRTPTGRALASPSRVVGTPSGGPEAHDWSPAVHLQALDDFLDEEVDAAASFSSAETPASAAIVPAGPALPPEGVAVCPAADDLRVPWVWHQPFVWAGAVDRKDVERAGRRREYIDDGVVTRLLALVAERAGPAATYLLVDTDRTSRLVATTDDDGTAVDLARAVFEDDTRDVLFAAFLGTGIHGHFALVRLDKQSSTFEWFDDLPYALPDARPEFERRLCERYGKPATWLEGTKTPPQTEEQRWECGLSTVNEAARLLGVTGVKATRQSVAAHLLADRPRVFAALGLPAASIGNDSSLSWTESPPPRDDHGSTSSRVPLLSATAVPGVPSASPVPSEPHPESVRSFCDGQGSTSTHRGSRGVPSVSPAPSKQNPRSYTVGPTPRTSTPAGDDVHVPLSPLADDRFVGSDNSIAANSVATSNRTDEPRRKEHRHEQRTRTTAAVREEIAAQDARIAALRKQNAALIEQNEVQAALIAQLRDEAKGAARFEHAPHHQPSFASERARAAERAASAASHGVASPMSTTPAFATTLLKSTGASPLASPFGGVPRLGAASFASNDGAAMPTAGRPVKPTTRAAASTPPPRSVERGHDGAPGGADSATTPGQRALLGLASGVLGVFDAIPDLDIYAGDSGARHTLAVHLRAALNAQPLGGRDAFSALDATLRGGHAAAPGELVDALLSRRVPVECLDKGRGECQTCAVHDCEGGELRAVAAMFAGHVTKCGRITLDPEDDDDDDEDGPGLIGQPPLPLAAPTWFAGCPACGAIGRPRAEAIGSWSAAAAPAVLIVTCTAYIDAPRDASFAFNDAPVPYRHLVTLHAPPSADDLAPANAVSGPVAVVYMLADPPSPGSSHETVPCDTAPNAVAVEEPSEQVAVPDGQRRREGQRGGRRRRGGAKRTKSTEDAPGRAHRAEGRPPLAAVVAAAAQPQAAADTAVPPAVVSTVCEIAAAVARCAPDGALRRAVDAAASNAAHNSVARLFAAAVHAAPAPRGHDAAARAAARLLSAHPGLAQTPRCDPGAVFEALLDRLGDAVRAPFLHTVTRHRPRCDGPSCPPPRPPVTREFAVRRLPLAYVASATPQEGGPVGLALLAEFCISGPNRAPIDVERAFPDACRREQCAARLTCGAELHNAPDVFALVLTGEEERVPPLQLTPRRFSVKVGRQLVAYDVVVAIRDGARVAVDAPCAVPAATPVLVLLQKRQPQ